VTAAAATQLVVTTQPPGTVTAGNAFTVVIKAEDPYGNVDLTFGGSETIALTANPGGSSLGGTLTVSASSGVATFSTLTLNKVGSGYALQTTSTGLNSASTNAFDVAANNA